MPPAQRYISPKERGGNRARSLREAVASFDAALGFPVLWLIKAKRRLTNEGGLNE
jgi:hypothetical protein